MNVRMASIACIALGSNVGDRRATLDGAVAALRRHPAIAVRRVSSWIETDPVGGPPGQGRYLNGAAVIETTLSPRDLLDTMQAIEQQFGRVRETPAGPRTLDLDLLLYDDRVIDEPGLAVPHPRMAGRRFVLEPLAEIAPQRRHPVYEATVAELLARLR
jgi:2-amino-4-hydroxy-6-hydroxymethyldihydropteridine diphosphokinase